MKINEFTPSAKIFEMMDKSGEDKKVKNEGSDFVSMLKDKLDEVNNKSVEANNLTEAMMKGEDVDAHQVTIAGEEAKLSIELAVQVRNKIVEAYQEINRMQL